MQITLTFPVPENESLSQHQIERVTEALVEKDINVTEVSRTTDTVTFASESEDKQQVLRPLFRSWLYQPVPLIDAYRFMMDP